VGAIAFAPDGRSFAGIVGRMDSAVCIWETANGCLRQRIELPPGTTESVTFSPDGKFLVAGGEWTVDGRPDHALRLLNPWTGEVVGRLPGHFGSVAALAFAADGKTLVSGGADTTILAWDAAQFKRPAAAEKALALEEQEGLWTKLREDATPAHAAMARLIAAGAASESFLAEKLRPAPVVDPAKLDRLIAELDDKDFAIRTRATEELKALGDLAEPGYEKMLAGQPGLEARQRVEELRTAARVPSPETLRSLRAVEVLERLGSPAARELLERLSQGAATARLTHEAKESLGRLAGK
jgi:hypothetical protein